MRQLDGTTGYSVVSTTTYEYDAFGDQTKTTFADGTFITAAYDGFGRKKSETNQLGLTRTQPEDLFYGCRHLCCSPPRVRAKHRAGALR